MFPVRALSVENGFQWADSSLCPNMYLLLLQTTATAATTTIHITIQFHLSEEGVGDGF